MIYNRDFVKQAFKTPLPGFINWDLLFNVAYCIDDESVKLYFIADELSFLYKCSQSGKLVKQSDARKTVFSVSKLNQFLGYALDYKDLVIDTVEDDVYYIYCEESGFEQTVRLLELLIEKYKISPEELFRAASRLNNRTIESFHQIIDYRAVSMVKIPLCNNNFKIYARPFKTRNDFIRPPKLDQFLCRVYNCAEKELSAYIWNMWVSYDFSNGHLTVSTQNDELKKMLV